MADEGNRTDIQLAWIAFVRSTGELCVPSPDDRPLDQFLPFRDKVLALVLSEQFLKELNKAWIDLTNNQDIRDALLLELKAFPLAAEVAKAANPTPTASKGWLHSLLGRASTVAGSVKDLVEKLPWWAKSAITLFKELVDLFKG